MCGSRSEIRLRPYVHHLVAESKRYREDIRFGGPELPRQACPSATPGEETAFHNYWVAKEAGTGAMRQGGPFFGSAIPSRGNLLQQLVAILGSYAGRVGTFRLVTDTSCFKHRGHVPAYKLKLSRHGTFTHTESGEYLPVPFVQCGRQRNQRTR